MSAFVKRPGLINGKKEESVYTSGDFDGNGKTDFLCGPLDDYRRIEEPPILRYFRKRFPKCKAEIIETYFEKFKSEEKFDVIVAGFVLEHVDNPSKILQYYKKYLSPGGKLFLTVPNAEVLNRRLGHLAGMLPDMQELSEHDHLCGHKRYYTVDSLTEEIEQAGYKIVRLEGIYLKPVTTHQMISLNFDNKILEALCIVGIDYPELSCSILAQAEL